MKKTTVKDLSNDEILEIINERKTTCKSLSEIGCKFGVSHTTVFELVRKEKEGILEGYLKNRSHQTDEKETLTGLKRIRFCEKEYNTFKKDTRITKFYSEELRIAGNIILSEADAENEIAKLLSLLNSYSFQQEFGRKYDIIDMYLTTNLTPRGLCEDYLPLIDSKTFAIRILPFLQNALIKVDNIDIFFNYMYNRKQTYLRYTRPSQSRIDAILNLDFLLCNKKRATKEDIKAAHVILLKLNELYGVKYDEISLYQVLETYLEGKADTYFIIGEKYKAELDQKTHVQRRCIPLLTRRENNK